MDQDQQDQRNEAERIAASRRACLAGVSIAGAVALVAALAPIAEAGVEAQHNETLVAA